MPDGATWGDHLRVAAQAGADVSTDLAAPPMPVGYDALVALFWRLRTSAGGNGVSPNAITCGEVRHWETLYGVRLMPEELDLIFAMDEAARAAFAETN